VLVKFQSSNFTLSGNKICLNIFSDQYIAADYVSWFNDQEVCKFNRHGETVYTLEKAKEYYEGIKKSENIIVFAICDNKTNKHVGNVSLDISGQNKSGDIAIIIGNKDYWGKGVATEAFGLVINFAFNSLNLNEVTAGMTTNNMGMIGVVEKLGFQKKGISKDALKKKNVYMDVVQWAMSNPKN